MAFTQVDLDKLEGVKNVKRYRNFGLCVVLVNREGKITHYWKDLGRFGGTLSEVGDTTEAEMPKLYVRVAAAIKRVKKLDDDFELSIVLPSHDAHVGEDPPHPTKYLRPTLAAWSHDDVYIYDVEGKIGRKSNALDKYVLHKGRWPGSPSGKGR
jgi:hypothetical protein